MIGSVADMVARLMSRLASGARVMVAKRNAAPRSSFLTSRTDESPLRGEGRERDGFGLGRHAEGRDGPVRHRHRYLPKERGGDGATPRRKAAIHHPDLAGVARV